MTTVLDSVDSFETAKIFDLDLAYTSYHYDLNSIRDDRGRFMEEMRALRIDERKDPHAIISDYRRLGEEHCVYHADLSDSDLVWTFLVVLEKMWGLTDPHADTNGLCPWICASAYSTGRAPPTAKAPPPRPDPPSDPPKAESTPQQPATFTFRPHVSVDLLPDSLHVPTEPATDDCPSADDDEPVLTSAFAFAAGASDDDDACWPALAESPVWIPKIAGTEF
ncbi:hypothetical protein CYMTET_14796 [Cymbomonas tetramitiformis]|uniref:Uncharacterized protein n=1 Tax=Cymbomonas tetramitiformis TaxID=36881 RepID=A0AAE0L9J8_9CHLO|nr:hypothetical protein CYMTET_14796 [Cymbomonas tetramitiformis]